MLDLTEQMSPVSAIAPYDEFARTTADGRTLWIAPGDSFDGMIQCAKWLAYVDVLGYSARFLSMNSRSGAKCF